MVKCSSVDPGFSAGCDGTCPMDLMFILPMNLYKSKVGCSHSMMASNRFMDSTLVKEAVSDGLEYICKEDTNHDITSAINKQV